MPELGRWNGHQFIVSPNVIRGITGLTIKGSCETGDKKSSKKEYVSRKNGKPTEVSITVNLNHMLGCNVRDEAVAFIREATDGKSDYFYVGSKKLVSCKLMLVDAQVKETNIGNGGVWLKADVQLTMKQCSKYGESSSGSKSGKKKKKSKKRSAKKYGVKTQKKDSEYVDPGTLRHRSRLSQKDPVRNIVTSAARHIRKLVNAAKNWTKSKKKK
ncbi:MAG: hypothetical protein IJS25_07265 [Bacteroidales bacterium]|nr:hypothetical protein [Bacteroidales bacterium]